MSRREKLLARIKKNPTNVSFEDLVKLLNLYGYVERRQRSGTSHFYFYRKGCEPLDIPKHKPVKTVYVKKVLQRIEVCGPPDEDDEE